MKRHSVTAAILLVALMFYACGLAGGATALIGVGVLFEGWFWARALGLKLPARRPGS